MEAESTGIRSPYLVRAHDAEETNSVRDTYLGTSLSSYFWCVSWLGLSLMERWRGRVALVTGASVGIGAAVAVELVRLGMKVVGCARDVGKIQKLAAECQSAGHPGVLVPFKCDLTKEEEILSMFATIKEQHKGVDVCINNAGLAHPEALLNGKTSGWKNMWDVRTQSYFRKKIFLVGMQYNIDNICNMLLCATYESIHRSGFPAEYCTLMK
ncbi:dehydrogenase/reductase SDR family member 11-like [Pundamilia nyererei]|uniref:Dehydrogenase/reductase SDR family member 11-like n=1 Tax=Pundamilia nyererei TaxID=303518 RepID=A0A9Y3VZA7_9CICH|nr:PREDICTED: dehydrogenase/reductase SDR family member 11-like [Pundamilia nyererei]